MQPSITLSGDKTEAARWVGFAKQKLSALRSIGFEGTKVLRPYNDVTVTIRIGGVVDRIIIHVSSFVKARFIGIPWDMDSTTGWGYPYEDTNQKDVNGNPMGTKGSDIAREVLIDPASRRLYRYPDYKTIPEFKKYLDEPERGLLYGTSYWMGKDGTIVSWDGIGSTGELTSIPMDSYIFTEGCKVACGMERTHYPPDYDDVNRSLYRDRKTLASIGMRFKCTFRLSMTWIFGLLPFGHYTNADDEKGSPLVYGAGYRGSKSPAYTGLSNRVYMGGEVIAEFPFRDRFVLGACIVRRDGKDYIRAILGEFSDNRLCIEDEYVIEAPLDNLYAYTIKKIASYGMREYLGAYKARGSGRGFPSTNILFAGNISDWSISDDGTTAVAVRRAYINGNIVIYIYKYDFETNSSAYVYWGHDIGRVLGYARPPSTEYSYSGGQVLCKTYLTRLYGELVRLPVYVYGPGVEQVKETADFPLDVKIVGGEVKAIFLRDVATFYGDYNEASLTTDSSASFSLLFSNGVIRHLSTQAGMYPGLKTTSGIDPVILYANAAIDIACVAVPIPVDGSSVSFELKLYIYSNLILTYRIPKDPVWVGASINGTVPNNAQVCSETGVKPCGGPTAATSKVSFMLRGYSVGTVNAYGLTCEVQYFVSGANTYVIFSMNQDIGLPARVFVFREQALIDEVDLQEFLSVGRYNTKVPNQYGTLGKIGLI